MPSWFVCCRGCFLSWFVCVVVCLLSWFVCCRGLFVVAACLFVVVVCLCRLLSWFVCCVFHLGILKVDMSLFKTRIRLQTCEDVEKKKMNKKKKNKQNNKKKKKTKLGLTPLGVVRRGHQTMAAEREPKERAQKYDDEHSKTYMQRKLKPTTTKIGELRYSSIHFDTLR